jgi:hypothetical protein
MSPEETHLVEMLGALFSRPRSDNHREAAYERWENPAYCDKQILGALLRTQGASIWFINYWASMSSEQRHEEAMRRIAGRNSLAFGKAIKAGWARGKANRGEEATSQIYLDVWAERSPEVRYAIAKKRWAGFSEDKRNRIIAAMHAASHSIPFAERSRASLIGAANKSTVKHNREHALEIYFAEGTGREIAAKFNVTINTVSRIKRCVRGFEWILSEIPQEKRIIKTTQQRKSEGATRGWETRRINERKSL